MNRSRRQILKVMAAAPLAITFGFAGASLMRFLKPTMSPLGFFDPADLPTSARKVAFQLSDFPEPWTCLPFEFHMKYTEFNPEQQLIRKVPGFAIRLEGDEIVAYSRICPRHGCILNYLADPPSYNCGCARGSERCCCAVNIANPVLICPCDHSVFDLADGARVIRGNTARPPRRFELDIRGDTIFVASLEVGGIQ